MLRKFLTHKRTRNACHIYTMLTNAARKKHLSFHTPGHKIGQWDLTELSFSDNLACPDGCIAKAQQDAADILSASACFFLTDGSTSGVFSMLYASKLLGVKTLVVPANAHKSVDNACAVFGLGTQRFSEVEQIPGMLEQADALLITSPNYYGNIPDLQALHTLCKAKNKLFLIDGAHGGHLHFDSALYAGTYADIWVDGVHKSLPAFTQAALVCAKTEETANALQSAVNVFRTTSPSYPILASIEYAVKYPRNEWLEAQVRAFANTQPRVQLHEDWTKLCVHIGKDAFAAQKHLENLGIYPEFCDGENIVFYLSPALKKSAFFALKTKLLQVFEKYPEVKTQHIPAPVFSQINGETEWVELAESEGRICAENCGLFPPCTPLILRGQKVDKTRVALLQNAPAVYGLQDKKICVYKQDDKVKI